MLTYVDIVTDKPEAWTLEYIQGDLCGWHGYHHTGRSKKNTTGADVSLPCAQFLT